MSDLVAHYLGFGTVIPTVLWRPYHCKVCECEGRSDENGRATCWQCGSTDTVWRWA